VAGQIVRQSLLLLPVPEATPIVHDYRRRYDRSAAAQVPEHVTLLYPFLPPNQLDAAVLASLRAWFAGWASFPYVLQRTVWFGQGLLYLCPEPAAPFVALTQALCERFGLQAYDGQYDESIPHLTVGYDGPREALAAVASELECVLPVQAVAREAWLMVGHNDTVWQVQERFALAPPRASALT
jgi:2'-5' RNA ligase